MNDPIVPFPKFGAGTGLHRVKFIADAMELDLAAFAPRACAVTGSNGKGSVAAMTASILAAEKTNVGLFTSPHLYSIRERFRIDGDPIDENALAAHWEKVLKACARYQEDHASDQIGGFEFLFLVAASWFAEQRCEFIVWEAGIGGRLDTTRLIRARQAALVSLDFEHTKLLGETLEEIAYQKIDIAPPGGKIFIGPCAGDLKARLEIHAALNGVEPVFVHENDAWCDSGDSAHIDVDLRGAVLRIAPPLAGPHQRSNAAIAAHLAYDILRADFVSDQNARSAVIAGLAATHWPGRLEKIETSPPIVVDVGHTPDGIRLARAGFEERHAPCVLVCGVSQDKSADAIIAQLAPGFRVIICAAALHKGAPPAEIAAMARVANPDAEIIVAEDMKDARNTALHRAQALNGSVYVAGGLFLAAEFAASHRGLDPARLRFF